MVDGSDEIFLDKLSMWVKKKKWRGIYFFLFSQFLLWLIISGLFSLAMPSDDKVDHKLRYINVLLNCNEIEFDIDNVARRKEKETLIREYRDGKVYYPECDSFLDKKSFAELFYAKGILLEQDRYYSEAFFNFSIAARNGNDSAVEKLDYWYKEGIYVTKDIFQTNVFRQIHRLVLGGMFLLVFVNLYNSLSIFYVLYFGICVLMLPFLFFYERVFLRHKR